MDRPEPALKPEWLKLSDGGAAGNASSNHRPGSSWHSDEFGKGASSRNKSSVVDQDRSLPSSSWRTLSVNNSRSHDKGSSRKSRAYGSFGRGSRESDREKDFNLRGREDRFIVRENGFHDHADPWQRGMPDRLSSKSCGITTGDGAPKGNGVISRGTITDPSFEKEFPSLGSEENNGFPEVRRVASPGINTTSQSIPSTAAAVHGIEAWNSLLAEIPDGGANGLCSTSLTQSSSVSQAFAASSAVGLNMAETVAQAPSRVHTPPERLKEPTCKQFKPLIPMTPSMPKSTMSRGGDSSIVPKSGQHFSSHPSVPALRVPLGPNIAKPPQLGNFQVLNHEKNGATPTTKDAPKVCNTPSSVHPLKNPTHQKLGVEGKNINFSSSQGPFGEKRLKSQAKGRQEFFNKIRNITSNASDAISETSDASSLTSLVDSGEQCVLDKDRHSSAKARASEETNPCPEPVDPEEEALLRSLGWDKNAVVDALTKEEIDAFYIKLEERNRSSKVLAKIMA